MIGIELVSWVWLAGARAELGPAPDGPMFVYASTTRTTWYAVPAEANVAGNDTVIEACGQRVHLDLRRLDVYEVDETTALRQLYAQGSDATARCLEPTVAWFYAGCPFPDPLTLEVDLNTLERAVLRSGTPAVLAQLAATRAERSCGSTLAGGLAPKGRSRQRRRQRQSCRPFLAHDARPPGAAQCQA